MNDLICSKLIGVNCASSKYLNAYSTVFNYLLSI